MLLICFILKNKYLEMQVAVFKLNVWYKVSWGNKYHVPEIQYKKEKIFIIAFCSPRVAN